MIAVPVRRAAADLPLTEGERAFLRHWECLRGDEFLPPRQCALPEALGRWLGWLHLLEVLQGGTDFRYRIFGSGPEDSTGYRFHRRLVSEWSEPMRTRAFEHYRLAVRAAWPLYRAISEDYGEAGHRTFSRVVVPLGHGDGGGPHGGRPMVTHLLVLLTEHSSPFDHDFVVIEPLS